VRDTSWIEESERPFGVQFFRVDTPSLERIDDLTLPLGRAASACDGEYDGWETSVVR
jgi:hypothetical protein